MTKATHLGTEGDDQRPSFETCARAWEGSRRGAKEVNELRMSKQHEGAIPPEPLQEQRDRRLEHFKQRLHFVYAQWSDFGMKLIRSMSCEAASQTAISAPRYACVELL